MPAELTERVGESYGNETEGRDLRRLIPALSLALALVSLVLADRGRAEVPGVFVASIDPAIHERNGSAATAFGLDAENGGTVGMLAAADLGNDTLARPLPGEGTSGPDLGTDGVVVARSGVPLDHEALPSPAPTATAGLSDGKSLPWVADAAADAIMVVASTEPGAGPPAVPAAPTVVPAAVGGTATLLVSWNAPADNGSPITGYVVRWRARTGDNSERFTAQNVNIGPGTTATITGLASSTAHRVRVRADNAEGNSGWSRPGEGRTDNASPVFADDTPETVTVTGSAVTVGTFRATDPDDPTLSYSLSGADASRFGISSVGVLTAGPGGLSDPDALGSTTLTATVGVSDGKSRTGTADTSVDASVAVTVVVVDVSLPSTPDAPTVTPAAVGGAATLLVSWVAPADNGSPITSYAVRWRARTGDNSERFTSDNVTIGTGTAATITGLASSTAHRVRVRATSAAGNSGWSSPGEGRTNNAPPVFQDGTVVTVTVSENSATVGTFPATNPENDTITYSLSGADALVFEIDSDGQVTALPNHPLTLSTLTITVQASDGRSPSGNADAEVDASLEVAIVVVSSPATPAAPTVTPAAIGGTATLSVSWRAPADNGSPITGYVVEWRVKTDDNSGTWTTNNVTGTAVTITGLRSSTTHEVRVRAINAEGNSDWSELGEGRTNNASPTFSGNATVTVTVAENTTVVHAFPATDPDGDTLTYSLSGEDASRFRIDSGGRITVVAGNPLDYETPGDRALTVTVGVSDQKSLSGAADTSVDASVVAVIMVTDIPVPVAPSAPTVTATFMDGTSNLVARWDAPTDNGAVIIGYVVQWRVKMDNDSETFTSDNVRSMRGRTSAELSTARRITGLASSTTHEVRVRAESVEGSGAWSGIGEGRTSNRPPEFNLLNAVTVPEGSTTVGRFPATDHDDATLTYSLSGEDASRFRIGSDAVVTVVDDNPLDYETPADRTLSIVVGVSDGQSPSGGPDPAVDTRTSVIIVVTDIPPPPAPETPSVNAPAAGGATTLSVTWAAPRDNGSSITAYTVEWRKETNSNDGTFTAAGVTTTETVATISGLMPSTPHEVRVRAESTEGSGLWSSFGEGRTNPNLDLNGYEGVTASDGLIALYSLENGTTLQNNGNLLSIVFRPLFPRAHPPSPEKLRKVLAAGRRLEANSSPVDLSRDGDFDASDARIFHFVLQFGDLFEREALNSLCHQTFDPLGMNLDREKNETCADFIRWVRGKVESFGSD